MSGKDPRRLCSNLQSSWFVHALAYCVCVAPIACSGVHPNELEASSTAAMVGGSLSPAERDAVVFIRANHADGAFDDCTGTLLSPSVVVTAKHCVTLVQPGEFVCNGAGTLSEDGQGSGLFGAKVEPAKIEIYPGTAPVDAASAHVLATFTAESGDACHDDIAALVLDTPIQQESYPPLRVARPTTIGEYVRLVGYGNVNHDALIERRELADVRILDVGHDDGVQNPNATTPARSFVVGGATACFGDSGGPALSMATGALTGVYSRITGDCFAVESRNTFILASSFSDLFARAFELAGEQPLLEPSLVATPPDPAGAGGSGGVATGAAGSGGVATGAAGSGGVATGAAGSGGVATGAAGSGGVATGTAGSGEEAEPAESSRHQALHCSLGQPKGGENPVAAAWLWLALAAEVSRRRFARRPSWAD